MAKSVRREVFHLLRRLMQEHTAIWQQHINALTKPQFAVLRAIDEQPGIEQVDLMGPAVATKATLADLLARLESRGLVRREPSLTDKRRRYVYLSERGKAVVAMAAPASKEADDVFLNRLSVAQQQELSRLLGLMLEEK
ncbi:MarR family winged helix-turn-helix transcriptional regulator [Gallaecimonas mangrovi]|uniref:MarR family winged helix-turn-helix transcriptional regulator n=1 Tax=Gallaecimonas mangrovi TaxID=2291597 RepID=UPI000E1FF32A|nr:MarR family transcriptional regulator [Gallaecimonas mangrovi]